MIAELIEASTKVVPRLVQAPATPNAVPAINKGVAAPAVMTVATPPRTVRTPPVIPAPLPTADAILHSFHTWSR